MTEERPEFETVWQNLPNPSLVLDGAGTILAVNTAAESFLATSTRKMTGKSIGALTGHSSRFNDLVARAAGQGVNMAEYDVELAWPDTPPRIVDIYTAPLSGDTDRLIVTIHPRAMAETMDRSLSHRSAARSVAGMAAMLAHEIKNPLAGISGAAQLLEMNASEADRELTQLIREEADRIDALMERVEQFGEIGMVRRRPVNIHDVLDRACRAAKAGFASHARFVEQYDPSLPPTMGDPDQLIQVLMNLLKNAGEATPPVGGVITVRTAYRAGMKVLTPTGKRESLPLQIVISDNGPGVPEDMQRDIFEPFVTSKSSGSGLGLALASKIVADHGGMISCDSQPGWTRFRLLLPKASAEDLALIGDEETAA